MQMMTEEKREKATDTDNSEKKKRELKWLRQEMPFFLKR